VEVGIEMKLLISIFGSPVALLLVSLGLVVLKRRSNLPAWMARLTTPPFYLVSLPIATLIVGAEMLVLYSLVVMSSLLCLMDFPGITNSNYFSSIRFLLFTFIDVQRSSLPSSGFGLRF
jgi:hypothetical protein